MIFDFCHLACVGDDVPHIHIYCRDSQKRRILKVSPHYWYKKQRSMVNAAMESKGLGVVSLHPAGVSIALYPEPVTA